MQSMGFIHEHKVGFFRNCNEENLSKQRPFIFSRAAFGVTLAGQWSNSFNDCGLFMTGVGGPQIYGDNCTDWEDASKWTDGTKAGLLAFASASMDALRDWFFVTWKVSLLRSLLFNPCIRVLNTTFNMIDR